MVGQAPSDVLKQHIRAVVAEGLKDEIHKMGVSSPRGPESSALSLCTFAVYSPFWRANMTLSGTLAFSHCFQP